MIKYGSDSQGLTQLQKIVINILGFILILLKNLLEIPTLNLILYAFMHQLSSGLTIGLSITFTVLLFPILLYNIFFFQDLNPFSTMVFAGETHYQRIICLLTKLGLVLYCILDKNKRLQLPMLIILLSSKLMGIIYNHYVKAGQQFNYKVRFYKQWQRYVIVWLILFILFS